ncbi:MAG: YybH family protein, partial [Burkholderiaceae bacterium]
LHGEYSRRLMRTRLIVAVIGILCLQACAVTQPAPAPSNLRQQVIDAERGFAQTMARRDFVAFTTFLADDTVFFDGDRPLRGKANVAADWKKFYEKAEAPFSWEPKDVEVLDEGTLAIGSGPVRNPQGKIVATFTSIWQLQDGAWKIIFDKGGAFCN